MLPMMIGRDGRERRMRGDALLLAHCRLLTAPVLSPRERLSDEVGERLASILLTGLVPQPGRYRSSSR